MERNKEMLTKSMLDLCQEGEGRSRDLDFCCVLEVSPMRVHFSFFFRFNRFPRDSLRKPAIKSKDFDYITVNILGLKDRHGSPLNLTTNEYHNLNRTANIQQHPF